MKKTIILILSFFLCIASLSAEASAEVYMEKATVSFYADDFHGKKTSSGETFNMHDFTCANKSLPFDTQLKVTNLANGKSVKVRVNDRGPFVADRELDLSKAAAEALGMIASGTAQVRIEILKRGPESDLSRITAEKAMKIVAQKSSSQQANQKNQKTGSVAKAESGSEKKEYPDGSRWDLQVGAFSTRENANQLAQKLLRAGFTDVVFQKTSKVYRVVIKNVPAEKVEKTKSRLAEKGFGEALVRPRKK